MRFSPTLSPRRIARAGPVTVAILILPVGSVPEPPVSTRLPSLTCQVTSHPHWRKTSSKKGTPARMPGDLPQRVAVRGASPTTKPA